MLDNETELGMPSGKRVGPENIASLEFNNYVVKVVHWGKERGLKQNGGYISIHDIKSGDEIKLIEVYQVEYLPDLEEDIQDVFIESLTIKGSMLLIKDERNRSFMVDIDNNTVHESS